MYRISDENIDFILADLYRRGIETESMRMNLLDHICIVIEEGLEEGGDFPSFYAAAIRTFYKEELRELEDEAQLLMTKASLIMNRDQFFFSMLALVMAPVLYRSACLVFLFHPLLVLLVIYLTPDRFDPLVPRGSRIILSPPMPIIKVVHADMAH